MPRVFLAALFLGLPWMATADPLFPNSVVSNDIDFITAQDRSVYGCMVYRGTARQEMPDKRGGGLFGDAHVIGLDFQDGTGMEIWVSTGLNRKQAESYAAKLGPALGKLPTIMRRKIGHVVVHKGDETAFAEDIGRFFTMYSRNIDKRISTNDLEETVFHEAMHASLQANELRKSAWKRAVRSDRAVITEYAATQAQEDFAEHGLFAYTYLRHPERLPATARNAVAEIIPARLAYFEILFPAKGEEFLRVGAYGGCK